MDPLSAPGKYKIENKYGVHSLIISRYGTETTVVVINQPIKQIRVLMVNGLTTPTRPPQRFGQFVGNQ